MSAEKRTAIDPGYEHRDFKNRTPQIVGNEQFSCPSTNFMISPLSSACDIYIDNIGTPEDMSRKFDTTAANDYTKIIGLTPGAKMHIDTTETFYLLWY